MLSKGAGLANAAYITDNEFGKPEVVYKSYLANVWRIFPRRESTDDEQLILELETTALDGQVWCLCQEKDLSPMKSSVTDEKQTMLWMKNNVTYEKQTMSRMKNRQCHR